MKVSLVTRTCCSRGEDGKEEEQGLADHLARGFQASKEDGLVASATFKIANTGHVDATEAYQVLGLQNVFCKLLLSLFLCLPRGLLRLLAKINAHSSLLHPQVYVRDPVGGATNVVKYWKRLAGFGRVFIKAGSSVQVGGVALAVHGSDDSGS